MSALKKSRYTQDVRTAVFKWNFDDTMVAVGDTSAVDFGAAQLTKKTFAVASLPVGAVVVGGKVVVKTAFDTAGYDVEVGDTVDDNRYLASTDAKAAGEYALVSTGYIGQGEDLALSFASDDVCTAGSAMLVVQYVIDGRADEVAKSS